MTTRAKKTEGDQNWHEKESGHDEQRHDPEERESLRGDKHE